MSKESTNGDVEHGGQVQAAEGVQREGSVTTPRFENPIAVKVLSPSTVASDSTLQQPPSDYFTANSVTGNTDDGEEYLSSLGRIGSITPAPTAVTGASDVTATGQLHLPDGGFSLDHSEQQRPAPQSHISSLSMESTRSSTTVTPGNAYHTTVSAPTPRRPEFPDQSYRALQNQHHIVRQHPPPVLRQRSSQPGQILTFSSALASIHQSGTRTAGNSPGVFSGAGLFNPNTAPPTEDYESPETPGTYASPFLHFTQRQAPRETHVADVDVDPISGRKLINHYEVVDELGRGTHGKVKLGRDLQTENTFVAIKIVERYSKRRKLGKLVSAAEDKVKKEVAILKKARHPNVVALLEVIDDPTRKKVYIVLEWVERGEIQWRTKTNKEIALVEARRYERERSGRNDVQTAAEDEAVGLEAQRRLAREHRRRTREHRRQVRRMLNEGSEVPESWSHELAGDEMSDTSEDERMSRVSTSTTIDSVTNRLFVETRRQSRTPSPLPPVASTVSTTTEHPHHSQLTSEPQTLSPVEMKNEVAASTRTGLEGTMYGSYAWSSSQSSRGNSLANSVHGEHIDPEELKLLAREILDSELNPELEYCPILTLQQARVAFRDTTLGLQYLHHQGIVHRDIKPPNLLQTNDHRVKISDFGVSYLGRPLNDTDDREEVSEHEAQDFDEAKELAKTVGTPAFFAPELCITDPGEDPMPVTKAIDVWALGITLFCMLFARTPFVDNEFIVMRQIVDEEIYIPRKRLMPVQQRPASRPSSHSRAFTPKPTGVRGELDLLYEAIDDDLYDLLKRLLIKDPRKRITLEEVRHHPWVVADLGNRIKWLEETDPARPSQGKKIEISNEDVKSAVVPLQFLDRVRSGIKKVTDRLGFSSSSRTGRGRTQSNAGLPGGPGSSPGSPSASAGSSSSTLNQDQRRASVRGDEDIFSALKASRPGERHGEHPLARSVAASPELERNESYFDRFNADVDPAAGSTRVHPPPPRPSPPERSKTLMSTAGSIRTLKQSDIDRGRESPPPSPGLPGTPLAVQSPGGSSLQAILGGGTARRAFKSLRERSTRRGVDRKSRSPDRESLSSVDAHGEPTLALSQTSAEGQVSLPPALQEFEAPGSWPSSIQNSPAPSRTPSVVASPAGHLQPASSFPGLMSRNSSGGSIRSLCGIPPVQLAELSKGSSRPQSRTAQQSSAEDWQRADDERIRKLIRENRENTERPTSSFDDRTCPPSPDDQREKRLESRQTSAVDVSNPASRPEPSPTGQITQLPSAMVSSSSDFGSAVSMSISDPSIPSVISEASSIDPTDGMPIEELDAKRNDNPGATLNPVQEEIFDEGYTPDEDQPLNSEDDGDFDSSSDSDGGLVMTRRRSKTTNHGHAGDSLKANAKERRGTGLSARSKKSSRSGSNNTMKTVRTRDSEEERRRSSNDLREE